ncbi:SAM-dependent methyltransferase [Candidatus Vecturithrix granuli]|uniref:SAM-dependent methyltransferase n=1 Tax=Vecturithrix granuli TaxID=1499967 RepID=A0A081C525_VECG1|nr:SAM-dependent methyltransferase [Candidatus Vecturithrix granuli]
MYNPDTETLETLKIGNLLYIQPKQGYRFSVDAILLADFVKVKPDERIIDLGTGSGILPLLIAALTPVCEIVGLELQERLAQIARRNVRLNALDDRIQILEGNLRQVPQLFRAGTFDVLCSNPPYRKVGSGRINPENEQAIARHEIACSLGDLLVAWKYLVKPGGRVFVVYLPERLSELLAGLTASRLEPKKLRCVHSTQQSSASLALVEAQRDASPGLIVLPPLFLYTNGQEYSEEAKRILREKDE